MKAVALVAALGCAVAGAQDSSAHRGWLSGGGLILAGVGAAGMTVGGYQLAEGDAAAHALRAYYSNGAAPTAREASTVRWLEERAGGLATTGLALVVGGGAAVLLGISLVLLDGWGGAPSVSLVIQPGPASVRVIGTF